MNKNLKNIVLGFGLVSLGGLSMVTHADENYGCRAMLCFAGGLGESECQDTIKKVRKDLAKGRGFPHCSFVEDNGKKTDLVQQSHKWTRNLGRNNNICPDGTQTGWWKKGFKCNAITVTFKGANEDGSDMVKEINW